MTCSETSGLANDRGRPSLPLSYPLNRGRVGDCGVREPSFSPMTSGARPDRVDTGFTEDSDVEEEIYKPKLVHHWNLDLEASCVAVAPKRNLVFCGTQDGTILVLNLDTFSKLGEMKSHFGSVLCITINADESLLFSGSSDSTVKVYDLDQMKATHTIYSVMDIGDIFSIAISDDSNTVFFGTQNASIIFADLSNILPKTDPSFLPSLRHDKFFDSKSQAGAKSQYTKAKKDIPETILIEIPSSNVIEYAHNGFVYSLRLAKRNAKYDYFNQIPDSVDEVLISTGGDGYAKVWTFSGKATLFKEFDNGESTLCSTIDSSYLYCGLTDGQVKVWDLSTFQHLRTIQADGSDIFAMTIFNNCLFKATRSGVTKWKLNGDFKSSWIAHEGSAVIAEKFTSEKDEHFLITGGLDKSLSLWNINDVKDGSHHRRSTASVHLSNEAMLETLKDLISFPTVSKKPEIYMDDSRKCANYLKTLFQKFGAKSQLIPVENGNPIVYAVFEGEAPTDAKASKPRILWYGHYDVIEADQDDWKTHPYELAAKNGYLCGRGVTDNKGPILAALYAVAQSLQEGQLFSDVVFLIEGEEESGSYGFQNAVLENKSLIGEIDWVLLSNSYWLDNEIPCLNYGLRGAICAEVEIFNENPDRHSGFEGADGKSEPAMDLMKVLSSLTDSDNRIAIPKFYETLKREQGFDELQNFENILRRTNLNFELDKLLSKWCKPSLSVHILDVSGPKNSTVIPHSASATISMRVVPEQDLSEIKKGLESHILNKFDKLNSDNKINFRIIHESEPWLGDPSNLAYQTLKQEIETEWAIEPLFVREGGSIPSIRFLEKIFNAAACQVPCGQSTDRAHLPNENLRIINLYKTRNILKRSFQNLPKNI